MKNILKPFTNKYSLSKTLRFELKPVGATLTNIEKKGLVSEDENLAVSYKKLKKVIDEYHKDFIGLALKDLKLNILDDYSDLYYKTIKDEIDKKRFIELQLNLRKQIVDSFSKNASDEIKNKFDRLFKKELIQIDLIEWLKSKNDFETIELVEKFKTFTTYFNGFNENRKNMYSVDEHSTAIAYRLIHENLPKFLDNLKAYRFIKKSYLDFDFNKIEKELELISVSFDSIFDVNGFNQTLTQNGIDFYNTMLGGLTEGHGKKKIKGLNEFINLYKQEKHLKSKEIPSLKVLFKQILSDRESVSFLQDEFIDDSDVLNSIEVFYREEIKEKVIDGNTINILETIDSVLKEIESFDTSKIYLRNDTSLTDISQRLYGSWSVVKNALSHYFEEIVKPLNGKKRTEKYDKELEQWLGKQNQQFSIKFLQDVCTSYFSSQDEKPLNVNGKEWLEYFKNTGSISNDVNSISFIKRIETAYSAIESFLNVELNSSNRKLVQEQVKVDLLKLFLDEIVTFLHFIKPITLKDSSIEKDDVFYSVLEGLYNQLDFVTPLYNKTRNYLTKKAYSLEKVKLNFQNAQLLNGWDVNKETDNTSILFRKEGLYYLCVMDKKHNKVFKSPNDFPKNEEEYYEKVNYKLLPGANKMLPKVFFSNKSIEYYAPSFELLEKYKNETHKKGETFNLNDCHDLIDFFKESINKHPDWKNFNYQFSETSSYEDLSGFYREVEHQGYKITFQNIATSYIDDLINEGKIYLFQIYNKDFSPFSKGKPNMHTLYWRALFDENNLKDVIYKLNGEAEIFYRKKSLEYSDDIWLKGHHANDLKDKFDYPIVKDKRFALDSFHFHVPITMNFKANEGNNFNGQVNEFLKNNKDINIIGIDRGERHLLYLTLINQRGEIIIQKSLNTITNKVKDELVSVDYHKRLDDREKNRNNARKTWGTIETIKELKEGYLSLVIHEVAKMMVENNAVVVLEDLNFGFKRGRQKVEKQVYQKFEKMLIDKLNYLIFKDRKDDEIGGVFNALQLTSKFESFQKLGKQSGFLFYIPAALTSKIDPATGFVNFMDTKYYSVEKSKEFFGKFSNIQYNIDKDYFEFEFDYNSFTTKAEGTKTKWKVCTSGDERWRYNPTTKNSERVNVTAELKTLFEKNQIIFKNGNDLKSYIIEKDEKGIYSTLLHLLGLTLSLRHSESGTENDFILSPVFNDSEVFFDSRKATEKSPKDSDANGAYHIALKGLWALRQIDSCDDWKKLKLAISNKEWLDFVQKRPFEK